jgi:aminopeptidase YwaD
MKRSFFLCIYSLSALVLQGQASGFDQSDSAIRARFVRDIAVLASDSLQGRLSGTSGEKKAYDYIIANFREAGLQPMGDSNSYLQSVPYTEENWTYKYKSNLLKAGGKSFVYRLNFGAVSFSADQETAGTLVVISGNRNARHDVTSEPASDLTGKVVLFDLDHFHFTGNEQASENRAEVELLAGNFFQKGANAVIFWDCEANYYPWLFNFSDKDTLTGPVIFVTYETGKKLSRMKSNTTVNLAVAKPSKARSTFHNVIGYLDKGAPATIILGAHYDHMGKNKEGRIRYGADDNASGTSMIMELARFVQQSEDHRFNFLIIAFSGEEEWLIGSTYYCSHPTIDLGKVSFMYNFDMVGRLGCEGNSITALGTASSADWMKIYRQIPNPGFRVKYMKGAASFSDHYPFYRKNIPVAYLTTGLHYDYHTPSDLPSKINCDGMVQLAHFAEDFIRICGDSGRIVFKPVKGWDQMNSTMHYVMEELDYMTTIGKGSAE